MHIRGDVCPRRGRGSPGGRTRFAEHPRWLNLHGEPMVTAAAAYLPQDARGLQRLTALAVPAMHEACAPLLNGDAPGAGKPVKLALFLSLPPARPGGQEDLAPGLVQHLREHGPGGVSLAHVEVIHSGHAGGWYALSQAARRLKEGALDFCLIGGADSYMGVETLEWLDSHEQLKSTSHRWGFIPGEAAGFCLLAAPRQAARYKLTSLLDLCSVGTSQEKNRIKTDTVCIGEGLTRAFRDALKPLPENEQVDEVLGDLNGERYRTDEYGFTIARLGYNFVDATRIRTPADCWGDVGAASGPLFLMLAAASGLRGYAKGPRILAWSGSENGERGAALLRLPSHQQRRN